MNTNEFTTLTPDTEYIIKVKVTDNVGNSSESNIKATTIKQSVNYGTSIQSNYPTIYTTLSPKTPVSKTAGVTMDDYKYGNFAYPNSLAGIIKENAEDINKATDSKSSYTYIKAGSNNVEFSRSSNNNRWILVMIHAGYYTNNVYVGSFKLKFTDGNSYTIQQAVDNRYIEPLVLLTSAQFAGDKNCWKDFFNIKDGGNISTVPYPMGYIIFKVKDKAMLNGVSIYASRDFYTPSDGVLVTEYSENIDLSISPIE